MIVGTASEEFTPTKYSVFSGYTFTSPNFRVRYSGDALTSLSNAFSNQTNLVSIHKWTVDTSNSTDMRWMFVACMLLPLLILAILIRLKLLT